MLCSERSPWLTTSNLSTDRLLLNSNTHLHMISGVQARVTSVDEPASLPRHRYASEGQNGPDDGPSPDVPVRSPIRCVSPEFVNTIAMNPGGRPKEVENTARLCCGFTVFPASACCFIRLFASPETHAQLPGGLRGDGRWADQSGPHSWW